MSDEVVSGIDPFCRLRVIVLLHNREGIVTISKQGDRQALIDPYLLHNLLEPHRFSSCSVECNVFCRSATSYNDLFFM
jgi:hypothetical protein